MMMFHGSSSPGAIDKAREYAPDHEHGYCWTPQKMTPHDTPYILDNGAYRAFVRNEPWDVDRFVRRLREVETRMPQSPEFVVLPDVVADADSTYERSKYWSYLIDETKALACQDGMTPTKACNVALDIGCDWLFVGGTIEWKRRNAKELVETAHENGLKCHIARPGPGNLAWLEEIDADSMDTSSIASNETWDRLIDMKEQQSIYRYDGR